MQRLVELLRQDVHRLELLKKVAFCGLPQCLLAAGFVRNLVWDSLHQFPPTPLNDVDVIYFDPDDESGLRGELAQARLLELAPEVNWQFKNQALMHLKNNHGPYKNCEDAMKHWPEQETAVGVAIDNNGDINVVAPFGLTGLFAGHVTYNTKGDKQAFLHRVKHKNWLTLWPRLKLVLD